MSNNDQDFLLVQDMQEIIDFNEELVSNDSGDDLDLSDLVIYSRDWTVETINVQIEAGNIDLNPNFQRRNVWNNHKRSKLIESLLIGYPVPEIVLAEVIGEKKKYIVIDGKQRLLAISGFLDESKLFWDNKAILKDLTVRKRLEGHSFKDFDASDKRHLLNADVRCTILSGYKNYSVLYDIFYRLNTGSSPLTMQELRNSIFKGPFSEYLNKFTEQKLALRDILNLSEADKRFRDVELILKYLSLEVSTTKYSGGLRRYLDEFAETMNDKWESSKKSISGKCELFDNSCKLLIELCNGDPKIVGRKWLSDESKWSSRFNRSLFEVLVHYCSNLGEYLDNPGHSVDKSIKDRFVPAIKKMFDNTEFVQSIESTTSGSAQHFKRFTISYDLLNRELGYQFELPTALRS